MSILLTGAFGYLGGRLLQSLDLPLIAASRSKPSWVESRFPQLAHRRLDLLDDSTHASALQGVHAVVHLASMDELESARDPDLSLRVSAEGTRKLLAACRRAGVKSFVDLST